MKLFWHLTLFFTTSSLLSANASEIIHQECFLLADIESGQIIRNTDPAFCKERLYPCSSFKVPLAVMGFDSGILKDANTRMKWDGTKQMIPAWERDHTAASWLQDSVVWYSQRITSQLGMARVLKFLKDWDYGNQDFSGGLTHAWLSSTLKISAVEQTDFIRKLWAKKLGTNPNAIEKTLNILPVAEDSSDLKVIGKTGSGFSWEDPKAKQQSDALFRVGWYVGLVKKAGKTYAFAAAIKDRSRRGEYVFTGQEAKKFVLKLLKETKL